MHAPPGKHVALLAAFAVVSACSATPAPSLADGLADDAGTVAIALTNLQAALDQRYDALPELYNQLLDMRLSVAVAVALDKAARVETTAESRANLEEYLQFGDTLLAALGDLDAAIATQQVDAATLAAFRIDAAAGAIAVDLPQDLCAVAVPASVLDLCTRPAPIGDYEARLQEVLLGFVASYRPVLRLPAAFGEVVSGIVLTELAPEVITLLDEVAAQIDALNPDPAHAAMHQALVAFIRDTRDRWAAVDTSRVDLLIAPYLLGDLQDITCVHFADAAAARSLLLGAVPDSAIPAAVTTFFDDPDSGCNR